MTAYLDTDALRDLGPLPSGLARLVRAVAADVHTDRRPAMGWAAPAGRPIRVCCARPGFVVAGIVRLPRAEVVREVELRVNADAIEMAGEGSGTAAMRLAATCVPLGQPMVRPDLIPGTWSEYDTGDTVDLTLTVPIVGSGARWHVVALWVWSLARDTETCSGTMDSLWALGGVEYTVTAGSLPGTVLPEHAVVYYADPASKPQDISVTPAGLAYQVEYIDSAHGRYYISPVTASLTNPGGDTQWDMRALGVLPLQSCHVRLVAQDPVPVPAASEYATRKPVDDDALALVDYTRAKQAGYLPYIWAHSGIGNFSSERQLWPQHNGSAIFLADSSYRTLRSGIAVDGTPGGNGLVAVAAFAGFSQSPQWFQGSMRVRARLAAYEIGDDPDTDTALAEGPWSRFLIPLPSEGAWLGPPDYSRLAQTMWGMGYFDHWQSRGVISGGDGASPDWGTLGVAEVKLPHVDSPAYRVALQLGWDADYGEAQFRSGATQVVLVASSCVGLDLDEESPT